MDSTAEKPSGFLVIDKPAGISSAKALNALKRRLPRGTKVGHAGTLDPFATGVLVALVGKATKQCERVMALPKQYETTLRLGATTATFDPEAEPVETPGVVAPPREDVERVVAEFRGEIEQVPPAFSAVKVGGRRAYDLARRGEQVQLQPKRVRVYAIRIEAYAWPELRLTVDSGRGFYVRSLARDVGERLGVGGYLTALRRTAVGPFRASEAVAWEAIEQVNVGERLLPVSFLEGELPTMGPCV